jgi:hypothetical protein
VAAAWAKVAAVLAVACALPACSNKARAPYVDVSSHPPGTGNPDGGASGEPDLTAGAPGTGAETGTGAATGNGSGTGNGTLNPNKVYLISTLATAERSFNLGYADPFTPRTYTLAVPADISPYVIHGTLLYDTVNEGFFEMVDDYSGSASPDTVPYPDDPKANDRAVDAPCPDDKPAVNYVAGPEAQLVYFCHDTNWYQNGKKLGPIQLGFEALGHDDLALVWKSQPFAVMHLTDLTPQLIDDELPIAVRASNKGFVYAIQGLRSLELHETDAKGNVTVLGNYPLPLDSTNVTLEGARLDGQRNLFLFATWTDTKNPERLIVEMEFGGESKIIYHSVTDDPYIVIEPGVVPEGLFTGP